MGIFISLFVNSIKETRAYVRFASKMSPQYSFIRTIMKVVLSPNFSCVHVALASTLDSRDERVR